MSEIKKQLNWRKWRAGLLVGAFFGVLNACAGLAGDMGWKSFLAVAATGILTHCGTWLKQHPIEEISDDTTQITKTASTGGQS